jgi:sensor histidine kinase YesM
MKNIYLICIVWSITSVCYAQNINPKDVFTLRHTKEKQPLKGYMSLLCDSLGSLSIQQVASLQYDTLFKKMSEWNTPVNLSPKLVFWIKVTIQNPTDENRWRIGSLERYNNTAYYSPDNTFFYTSKSGINYKPSERFIPYHPIANYFAPLYLTKKAQNVYIRIGLLANRNIAASKNQVIGFINKFYIIPEKKLEIEYSIENNFDILFFGVCIGMMIYNFFIFIFVKDKSYLYYSIAILGVIFYFIYLNAYYSGLLFDASKTHLERDIDDVISAFSADISIFFFLSFSQIFLFANDKKVMWYKVIHYIKWYLIIANGVFKCVLLILNKFLYEISTLFHNINYGVAICSLIVLCIFLWRTRKTIYLYYVYANFPFFILIIFYILYGHFYIDREKTIFLLDNSFQIGIMLQIISFSIALAARINFMRHEIEQKKLDNEQLSHRLLRTQMNPHFIFNSLGSIQNYLFENDAQKTAKYLANFAKLMRRILESSREDFVPLEKEIQTLETYCMLQQMRFGGNLTYTITASPDLDVEEIQVPPMFAQPFIENAIEHGLMHRPDGGEIQVMFSLAGEVVVLEVKDNGLGIERTKNLPEKPRKEHQSLATRITQERLSLLRQKTQMPLAFSLQEITSPEGETLGTQVRIELPYTF